MDILQHLQNLTEEYRWFQNQSSFFLAVHFNTTYDEYKKFEWEHKFQKEIQRLKELLNKE